MNQQTIDYLNNQRNCFKQEYALFESAMLYGNYRGADESFKKEIEIVQAQLPNEVIDSDLLFLIYKSLRDADLYYQDKTDYEHLFLEEAILVNQNNFYIHYRSKIIALQNRLPAKVYTPELKQLFKKIGIK